MAHQIIVTISDEAFAAMTAAAEEKGQPIERVAAETLSNRFATISPPALPSSYATLVHFLHKKGDVLNLPDSNADDESVQEIIELTGAIAPGKPLSEVIIGDRGPYTEIGAILKRNTTTLGKRGSP
jgi:hypothetical protein